MKRILSTILLITVMLGTLAACGGASDIPSGMQLAGGGDDLGYYFYVPEEWVLSSIGNVSAAYASKVDASSASYVEVTAPALTGDDAMTLAERRAASVLLYFNESLGDYPTTPTVVIGGEAATFGNADHAFKYVFDHEYQEHKFRTMQIFVYFEDRFGIFTFNSPNEPMSSDEPQFEFYSEKVSDMTDNFKFVTKAAGGENDDTREADEEGYLLSSRPEIAGFSLYLPPEFKLEYSDGIVGASLSDGSSLTASRATSVNVSVSDYWQYRKSELEAIFGTVNEIEIDKQVDLSGVSFAFSYEYTYNYRGEVYHVYQVLAATSRNGYVFTYTAKEASYAIHLPVIEKIISKVEF